MVLRNVLVLLLLILGMFGRAEACSCATSSREDGFRNAEHVFIARIESVRHVQQSPGRLIDATGRRVYPQMATFSLVERFKGDPKQVTALRTGYGGGDCGVPLIVGFEYMVLVEDDGIVSMCKGFYGPHARWHERANDSAKTSLKRFTASVEDFFRTGRPIADPPEPAYGIGDSFIPPPPPPPEQTKIKQVDAGCSSD